MFKYKYKMTVVNPEKGIITLTPVWTTYLKAFAPAAIFMGGLTVVGMVINMLEEDDKPSLTEDTTVDYPKYS